MPGRVVQKAKRAFVTVLLYLCQQYGLRAGFTRESTDETLMSVFRRVAKKAHPDKGGHHKDFTKLQACRQKWQDAKAKASAARVRKPEGQSALAVRQQKEYRIRSAAVLLTYMGVGLSQWGTFLKFVESSFEEWRGKYWCCTMERCKAGNIHIHLMLQFKKADDKRLVQQFKFRNISPNASCTDICGEGQNSKRWQESVNRGFFYCFADKIGTVSNSGGEMLTAGNYLPCWTTSTMNYQVLGKWAETLYKQYKITADVYERYLYLCRDGVLARARSLQACREHEAKRQAEGDIAARIKRIRSNPAIYKPFPKVQAAIDWLRQFDCDALRYPILIVLGPSRAGKTEWAKSLFASPLEIKIGSLTFFPDKLREFKRGVTDGLVLDDVRDLQFIVDHQDKLQRKYDCLVEFGSTAGGTCAYRLDLFRIHVVVTINYSTANLQWLEEHDWLGNPGNRVVVRFGEASATVNS